jgi:tRNA-specific 2-thiouridylase
MCPGLSYAGDADSSNQHNLFRMKKIAVLLSGGVDSLVAARILKDQGHAIFGIHFFTGYEPRDSARHAEKTSSLPPPPGKPRDAAAGIASHLHDQLEIPVEIFDARKAFQSLVVDYFVHTYQKGSTPNPCMVCNPSIKFGACLELAEKLGATHLATGHYARVEKDSKGTFHLLRGKDHKKDQSYFLARLNQQMLSRAVFPLGTFTKAETIAQSLTWGIRPVLFRESQDICFINDCTYGEFLGRQPGFNCRKGPVEDVSGQIIGEHIGLHHYTIGQRRGINIPASEPYYVIRIDVEQNRLVVGFKQDVFSTSAYVKLIQWIHETPLQPIRVMTRIRYRHKAAASLLAPLDEHSAHIRFDTPQSAITPGQAAVFYDKDELLGGGWITAETCWGQT